MKKSFTNKEFNEILSILSNDYDIYAPITLPYKGTFSDTDSIKYGKISNIEEINLNNKSHYSAKEILLPITQTLFYFTEKEFIKPKIKTKKSLIFLRSCDLHSVNRVENIYLHNKYSDEYYKEVRDKVKFIVMGCPGQGWDSCFCASMGTNKTEMYNIGVKFQDNKIFVDVKDQDFKEVFNNGVDSEFEMEFVTSNKEVVTIPERINEDEVINFEMWRDYDRCIACGRCNFVCPTCTCFTMQDIFYKDNEKNGERRRVWASCHVDGFTTMAGGHEFRKKTGDRMRFKVLHKISDYKKRFGVQMCTGCGRCEDICPEYISYINCINKLAKKLGDKND
ncbi:anaerobic sulfite reductase subunit AsrA [Cetobacterium sp. 2A]|uniref:anaerobic sulfite reductase subunit AsrA n=1 Tax=unclassified Cetobacterium TaxID=2630983 RepID=UPI00163CCE68|nr:anaerobic sulfite reductase subunit AsrA [Cetobacterium sp. 2A]MBC2857333.1 anaerobic sulfite reductase subunit AsrA [Cetobacterium sp. 2A]